MIMETSALCARNNVGPQRPARALAPCPFHATRYGPPPWAEAAHILTVRLLSPHSRVAFRRAITRGRILPDDAGRRPTSLPPPVRSPPARRTTRTPRGARRCARPREKCPSSRQFAHRKGPSGKRLRYPTNRARPVRSEVSRSVLISLAGSCREGKRFV